MSRCLRCQRSGLKRLSLELFELGVGIGDVLLHRPREQLVEGGDVCEPAWAFEGFEKMTRFDVGDTLVGMEVEEFLAGG